MKKIKLVFEELKQKFEFNNLKKAAIHWLPIGNSYSEEFEAHFAGGKITLKAHGYLGAIYGLQAMQTALSSGHLACFLGHSSPHFKLRPIELNEDIKNISLDPAKLHEFCKRVLELGYNSILVDQENQPDIKTLCTHLKDYGLKIILKPFVHNQKLKFSPSSKLYQASLKECFKNILDANFDFLFWDSHWQHPDFTHDPSAEALTLPELVLAEARSLEAIFKNVIFYVPAADEHSAKQSAEWIPQLVDDLQQGTILAFSAVSGDFFLDFLPFHPLWEKLRHRIKPSSSSFMPIVNIGNLRQSEGFWPIFMHDFIDECISKCNNGNFVGILSLAKHLPSEGGVHECNLWVASQTMHRPQLSACLWQETWFSAFRPDWNYFNYAPILNQIRLLSLQLNELLNLSDKKSQERLSPQEFRMIIESILAQINAIQIKLEKEEKRRIKKSEQTTFWDYFTYFANDVRKTILHILHCFNLSIPHGIDENVLKESFWTEYSPQSRRITFLSSPNKGLPGSRMSLIYQENRLF